MVSSNTYGRQVIEVLTNKSGGGVVLGDAVIVDTSNNDAFTTTTSAATTAIVGIALETIASNAAGRVLTQGYAPLVNVNASVTRGHYGATHTVAKQVADSGTSRTAGTFCQFLTGGTTPDAHVFNPDLSGAALSNPMSAKGQMIQGDTGGTPSALAVGAVGQILRSGGSGAFNTWGYLPLHGVKAYNSATQSVSNTSVALTFDSEEFDTDAFHDTGSNTSRITIPSGFDGYYLLQAGTFASGGSDWLGFKKTVSGPTTTNIRGFQTTLSGGGAYRSATAIVQLAATDYVEAWVSTTGTITFGHASLLDAQSWFAATLLGV